MDKNGSVLMEIQDTISQYASIISQVTKVHVEITDKNYVRIAGTGGFSDNIGKRIEQISSIIRNTIERATYSVILEPRKDPICLKCEHRDTCTETMEIVAPIILNGETEGTISLIATDMQQRQKLIDEQRTYIDFILQIAEFISIKAYEYLEITQQLQQTDMMRKIFDHIEECVITLDNNNLLQYYNLKAKLHLGLTNAHYNKQLFLEATGDYLHQTTEYRMRLGDGPEYYINGNIYSFNRISSSPMQILIFKEKKQLVSSAYQFSDSTVNVKEIDSIVGKAPGMQKLKANISRVAKSKSTVLITGESGTGKEMVATAIWKASDRRNQSFVAINCAAIPDTLLESELFGYVKGAFTGASPNGKMGKFELADKGILFLDEIGDMPLYLQSKLLRVLQSKQVSRLGSNNLINVDVRILAATNQDLKELIRENRFRQDLYYRLNVIPLHVPPLRERTDDLESLLCVFLNTYSQRMKKNITHIDAEVFEVLRQYSWPGNVRELENTAEFMINMMDESGVLTADLIPDSIINTRRNAVEIRDASYLTDVRPLKEVEHMEIKKAIMLFGDSTEGKKLAAEKLGIGVSTLYKKLREYQNDPLSN